MGTWKLPTAYIFTLLSVTVQHKKGNHKIASYRLNIYVSGRFRNFTMSSCRAETCFLLFWYYRNHSYFPFPLLKSGENIQGYNFNSKERF